MNEHSLNIKFVENIEKRPVLYNYTLPGYSRKDLTEKAWAEVGKEVDMSVAECKERWKNLRAVFVRNMKSALSGGESNNKKPYYLSDAMQFTLPYVKAITKSPGNIPRPPLKEEDEYLNNDAIIEEKVVVEESQSLPSHSTSAQVSIMPPPPLPSTAVVCPEPTRTSEQYTQLSSKQVQKRGTRDNYFDFEAKKSKLATTENDLKKNPKSEALRMFLLSMMPDLESMTDNQVRKFKRRCLQTIDDILNPPTPPHYPISSPDCILLHQSPTHSDHSSTQHSLTSQLPHYSISSEDSLLVRQSPTHTDNFSTQHSE